MRIKYKKLKLQSKKLDLIEFEEKGFYCFFEKNTGIKCYGPTEKSALKNFKTTVAVWWIEYVEKYEKDKFTDSAKEFKSVLELCFEKI